MNIPISIGWFRQTNVLRIMVFEHRKRLTTDVMGK